MIDTHNIIQGSHGLNTLSPPRIIILLHRAPTEQWIAPQLSVSGKSVRRASGHLNRIQILIQIELLGIRPYICAVPGNIDRHISDNLNSLFIGISLQFLPLLEEQILQHLIELDIVRILLLRLIQCARLAALDIIIPFKPCNTAVGIFQCHEQRVILQPVCFLLAERCKIRRSLFDKTRICLLQQSVSADIHRSVIHILLASSPVKGFALRLRQKFVFAQILQINKIRIPCETGKRLIR